MQTHPSIDHQPGFVDRWLQMLIRFETKCLASTGIASIAILAKSRLVTHAKSWHYVI